jgi:hypothetical protein
MLLPPRPQQYFCKLILLSAFGRFTFIFNVATACFGFAGIEAVRSPVELTMAEFLPLLLLASVMLGNIPDFSASSRAARPKTSGPFLQECEDLGDS